MGILRFVIWTSLCIAFGVERVSNFFRGHERFSLHDGKMIPLGVCCSTRAGTRVGGTAPPAK